MSENPDPAGPVFVTSLTTGCLVPNWRARLVSSTSPFPMLRGPNVAYAPDEEVAADPVDETPEEFREQPGDREPEAEVEVAAEPEPEPEAEEVEEEPEPEPEPEVEEVEASEPEPDPEPAKKDWRDRQIAKLRDREKADKDALADAVRRAEAAEALLAATPEERESGLTAAERDKIRKEEAGKLEKAAWNKRVGGALDAMYEAGAKAFGKTWETRVAETAEVFSDQLRAREDFLEALSDLPNSHTVYNDLMGDPDKLEGVLGMPAHKMGMELARLSDKLAKPVARTVSKVPPPIRPIDRGGQEPDIEALASDPSPAAQEAFFRRMDAEERKRAAKAH